MVFFVCEDCNETLKRLKVAAHLCKCSCSAITCVDCNKSFYDDSYLQHSTCMSEAERYEGHLYQAPKKRSAQDAWSDVVEGSAGDPWPPTNEAPLQATVCRADFWRDEPCLVEPSLKCPLCQFMEDSPCAAVFKVWEACLDDVEAKHGDQDKEKK